MKKTLRFLVVTLIVAAFVATLAIGLAACNKDDRTLRFAAPDGTPALAMLRLASQKQKLGDYDVEYEVTSPENIGIEMSGEKADIIIMPVNAGAAQIATQGKEYRLVSVAVEGSLYLVGHKDADNGVIPAITLEDIKGKRIACIGEQGVPGLVFRYVMAHNNIEIITSGEPTSSQVLVEYVKDGQVAASRYAGHQADFIVVGEPAATAQKANANNDINAEMNMQTEYGKVSGLIGVDNYPQAGLFVRSSLCTDAKFMHDLFEALNNNKDWIEANPDKVTDEARGIGSASTFPKPSIPRCAIDCDGIDNEDANEIVKFLSNVAPSIDWAQSKDKIFFIEG